MDDTSLVQLIGGPFDGLGIMLGPKAKVIRMETRAGAGHEYERDGDRFMWVTPSGEPLPLPAQDASQRRFV